MVGDFQILLLVLLFIVTVVGFTALLAVASGWRTLAERFPSVEQLDGVRYRFASAKMGRVPWFPVNYRATLTIIVSRSGLSIATHFPFRLFCPAFFVPWSEFESVEENSTALGRRTAMRIRDSAVRLTLRGSVAQSVFVTYANAKSSAAY